nr:DUF6338 family protein [Acidithiobacillus ferrooxidans]
MRLRIVALTMHYYFGQSHWLRQVILRMIARSYIGFFFVLVLLVAPIAWAFLYKRLRTTSWAQKAIPHPTEKPWDYVFGQSKPYWVIVTLKDGTRLGGLYDTESFASSAPAPEQIYLQETWILNDDGGFERAKTNTAGIIILSSDITAVEFFNV